MVKLGKKVDPDHPDATTYVLGRLWANSNCNRIILIKKSRRNTRLDFLNGFVESCHIG